jgi:hypothetical protein
MKDGSSRVFLGKDRLVVSDAPGLRCRNFQASGLIVAFPGRAPIRRSTD